MAKIEKFHVVIIGAGFAGIGAAIKLQQAGFTDIVILEKADEIGGVWRANTYPGCACDVPSALYSYSFAPNPQWSRVFAQQQEIKTYIQHVAQQFDVKKYVRFGYEMLESAWDDQAKHWVVKTNQGLIHARFAIMAGGPMHQPVLPKIKGLETFKGAQFHSAEWNHAFDLNGKKVAVVGAGASAIQFVPEIQAQVEKLTLLQRTPQWVLPKMDQSLPKLAQALFKVLPVTQRLTRYGVYGVFESLNSSMHHPKLVSQIERLAKLNIRLGVKDPELRAKLLPDFTIGCKRVLQSNQWYPALAKPNVEVLRCGVEEVRGNTLIASDGSEHEVDAIIFGTGFEVSNPPIAKQIRNKHGKSMDEVWQGSAKGYLGTVVEGCPNAFVMFGPNIAVSSSALIIIEAQLTYILDMLKKVQAQQIETVEIRAEVLEQYNDEIQAALKNTVWNTGGCSSYFIDRNGRNSTLWPWTTFEMRSRLAHCDLNDYVLGFTKSETDKKAS
ncbi:Baeyer-Villiger monooxygenase [Acinetobacter gyllenbergii]|uniref:Cyclohexanone monooxygenase n=1 Tax=Acinetobacter gyllenbergii CIP 110306 = MTCC 11365 TaxID=1217657 RepID=A0A829HAV9_9GAMM|nr:NAD(P)/FAD-dependent oxidoreductase [Acinetobacter gyllenbergii]EPF69486.1 cyclohexanone monooxygenase [Acinetobacter gyllenbergii CIP 110306 = MTCC 11365]EPH33012.1 Cyclohexanone monooxygenase [Acinetobacter gyllenbergii CIP 110306 = MTCC 11365]GMA11433.1 Baeyer-Villiger monooxygenase [Acinetobacter gyllenbergii]